MMARLIKMTLLAGLLLNFSVASAIAANCPEYLNQSFMKLHSDKTLNLCEAYAGKPLLIVNTASFCGFTPQFSGLELLHKRYKDKGLVVLGFASDDFFQEADSDKEIADVCYLNYGVTFDMFSPIHVRGSDAHPLFKALSEQSSSPKWNFSKYLVGKDGKVVKYFNSLTTPDSDELNQAIESLLNTH